MTKIDVSEIETPNKGVDHSGRWVLLSGVGFVLFVGGVLLMFRWLGLK